MEGKKTSNLKHVVLVTLSAAIGGFLFGFDSSVINGANFFVAKFITETKGKTLESM